LLTDTRFTDITRAVGRLTPAELEDSRTALEPLPEGAEIVDGPVLLEPRSLRALGIGLTWGGFALEGLLALAFLAGRPSWIVRLRHPLLLLFCVSTYAIAPVAGFGVLLIAMGLAQTGGSQARLRAVYLGACALVLIYSETPLVHLLLRRVAPA